MKKYAVIVAGGSGSRMGGQLPKQFLLLNGKPVLWYTLTVFLEAYDDLEVILVLPQEHMEAGRTIAAEMADALPEAEVATERFTAGRIRLVAGGMTRYHSVQNGLKLIGADAASSSGSGEGSVIFVHDGVRCLLTTDLVHRCYASAVQHGSAIPVIDSRDSVRLVSAGGSEAIDRSRVKLVQTPQTFLSELLLSSYIIDYRESFTDEATVVEAAGHAVCLVEGESSNIKITMPVDLVMAEKILEGRSRGTGWSG